MRLLLIILCSVGLSACQLLPKKASPAQVQEIDQTSDDSIIKTVPLMKPAVSNLHQQAQEQYQLGEFDKALSTLKRAHEIQDNAPLVVQLLAEITLQQGDYSQAFYWSKLATQNGPSKGPICEKSWRILALSAEMIGETPTQYDALEQKENCLVRQQNRY